MEPFAVFAFSAILISLFSVFLYVGKGLLAGDNQRRFSLPQPVILTASAVILIGVFLSSLFIGREIIYADNVIKNSPEQAIREGTTQDLQELENLATKLDKAADNIYSGLDTTQEIIGKTEMRKAAIEHGRTHANSKLVKLSNRIRNALRGEQPLKPFDRRAAEHVTEGVE